MTLNEWTAKALLDETHRAWSAGDLKALLDTYTDDIVYVCNTHHPKGRAMTLNGRAAMHDFLAPVLDVAESMSVTESFEYHSGIGRAHVATFIRHRLTGHVLSGTYRQVVMFRDSRICRLEEFHDATKMAAFWRLVETEAAKMNSR